LPIPNLRQTQFVSDINKHNLTILRILSVQKKAGIIYNDGKPTACQLAEELQDKLKSHGWDVYATNSSGGMLGYSHPDRPICHTPIDSLVPEGFDPDMQFAVVLGGDGTVLSAFRQVAPSGIPLLTVNTGHLGFLTEIYSNHLWSAVDEVIAGNYQIEERSMLSIQLFQEQYLQWEALCLNEMVIHREPLTSMCHFEVAIGDHSLVDIAADGIIIATPTGSTAYALSAGGPVITPGVPVLTLVPICPHSLASRALVFANTQPVTIFPATPNPLILTVDGNAACSVSPEDTVKVMKARYTAKFIRVKPPEYFRILREKLGWGLPHIAKPSL
jgi:NAD+ kinase